MTPPAGASCDDPARSEAALAAQLKDLKESRAEITTKIVNLVDSMSGSDEIDHGASSSSSDERDDRELWGRQPRDGDDQGTRWGVG
jgi:hypothetical protein